MKKVLTLLLVSLPLSAMSAELIYEFKDPAFNGIGWSSHALTIESIEKSRRDSIKAEKQAEIDKLAAEAANTPLNRFMALFQSQVYAQLATQLSNNLFKNNCNASDGTAIPGCVNPVTGTFQLDGNTVTWLKGVDSVTLTVVDSNGTITKIEVPIASFAF
jgi:hypothetical protein